MEVILLERVEKLGQIGDVVNVKPGFARNFLLPRNKALRATDNNKKQVEAQRVHLEADNLERKDEAAAIAGKMTGTVVTLIRQAGEAGHLYGSVNARDIALSLTDAGFTVTRGQIALADPIKTLGMYDVSVKLHPEVAESISVNVARSEEEALIQAETGKAVSSRDEDERTEAEEAHAQEIAEVFEEGAAEEAVEHILEAEAEDEAAEAVAEEAPAAEETAAEETAAEEDKAE